MATTSRDDHGSSGSREKRTISRYFLSFIRLMPFAYASRYSRYGEASLSIIAAARPWKSITVASLSIRPAFSPYNSPIRPRASAR